MAFDLQLIMRAVQPSCNVGDDLDGHGAHFEHGQMEGGEWRQGELGDIAIVETDDRDVLRAQLADLKGSKQEKKS